MIPLLLESAMRSSSGNPVSPVVARYASTQACVASSVIWLTRHQVRGLRVAPNAAPVVARTISR